MAVALTKLDQRRIGIGTGGDGEFAPAKPASVEQIAYLQRRRGARIGAIFDERIAEYAAIVIGVDLVGAEEGESVAIADRYAISELVGAKGAKKAAL